MCKLNNMSADSNIAPLYFMNNSVPNNLSLSEYDVCSAMEDVIDCSKIIGCQKIRNLWRLYVKSENARLTLLQHGISVMFQHIDLYDDNPTQFQNRILQPIKIMIKDIPMSYTNSSIKESLLKQKIKFTSHIMSSKLRDAEGNLTNYFNGDRFAFVDRTETLKNPIPRFVLIGSFVARIHYKEQPQTNQLCEKCESTDHPTWRCHSKVCEVCKEENHFPGSRDCEFYCENNAYTFGGRNDPLGLSNFTECKFTYNNFEYNSREVAYQHSLALKEGQSDLAEAIYKSDSPQAAKEFSKCIKKNHWENTHYTLMTDICVAAARDNQKYKDNILKTKDRLLVEAISSQYYWGSGLNHHQSKHVRQDKLPGFNKMGVILMNVRDQLLKDEIVNSDCDEVTSDAQMANHEPNLKHSSISKPVISPKPPRLGTPKRRQPSSTPESDRKTDKNVKHNESYIQELQEDTSDFNDSDISNKENRPDNT